MSADVLDRVRPAASDLLARVDAALEAYGAPQSHGVWTQARRVGAGPAAAVAHFERLDAAQVRAAADRMRLAASAVSTALAGAPDTTWAGASASAYASRRAALDGFAAEAQQRAFATARQLDAVADWIEDSRSRIAGDLATCLVSHEAVVLRAGAAEAEVATAAATIAAHVLRTVAGCVESGWDVHGDWQGALGPADWVEPPAGLAPAAHIEVR